MRDILTSPRMEDIKRKRRKLRLRLLVLISILAITIIGALSYFSSNHRVTIHTITVTGTRIINIDDVQSIVQNDLAGKYIYLFAKSNILIYPHNRIYRDVLKAFPRIDTLSVTRIGWNTLHVAITERAGAFLYCGTQLPAQQDLGENCYFINNDGYIFDKAPYFSGNVYFKYYLDLGAANNNPLGIQMLPVDTFHKLTRFIDMIGTLGLKPNSLTLGPDGMYTLYLDHEPTATAPVIMFDTDNDLNTIADNLSIAMANASFADDIHSKYATLLYIDLRFKNKVLYKFNQ